MNLAPFLLDHWLAKYEFAKPPVRYNLASSTGPRLTVAEVIALGPGADFGDVALSYGPPDGVPILREAIAAFHNVDPDWVVVTTGASEALSILFCLAAEPQAEIVLPSPQFPTFDTLARAWGLEVKHYHLRPEAHFAQSAADVMAAIGPKSVMALINSPHNPTGSVMAKQEFDVLADQLRARGVPLVADEVYHPLYFAEPLPSAANVANVIVIGDMSKALCLPGLRVGWIIDRDSERRERIIDARSYFTISGSPLSEAIAAHVLRNHYEIIARLREVTRRNLTSLQGFMESASDVLDWVAPKGGTIAFPWFKDGRNARSFCEAAAGAGVLVAPGDCFSAPSHMRVGFGAQPEGYEDALALLGDVLRKT